VDSPVIFVLAGVNGAGKSSVGGAQLRARGQSYFNPDEARVRARIAAGGHEIPEAMIRKRWNTSRRNLIALMPHLTELKLFDNSEEGDPAKGTIPSPALLLHWARGRVIAPESSQLEKTPEWAKAIVARALQLQRTR